MPKRLTLVRPVVCFWVDVAPGSRKHGLQCYYSRRPGTFKACLQTPCSSFILVEHVPQVRKERPNAVSHSRKWQFAFQEDCVSSSFSPLHPLTTGNTLSTQFSKSQERSQSSQRAVYGLKTLGRRNNNKVNATSPFPCAYVIKGQTAVSGRAGRGLGTQLCTSSRPPCFGGLGREYPSSCQEALTRACLGLSLSHHRELGRPL